MLDFGFVEGEDFLSILTESSGGRPAMEYYISIDMAKEICMIQRSEIGRKFRQYFIECEKRLKDNALTSFLLFFSILFQYTFTYKHTFLFYL